MAETSAGSIHVPPTRDRMDTVILIQSTNSQAECNPAWDTARSWSLRGAKRSIPSPILGKMDMGDSIFGVETVPANQREKVNLCHSVSDTAAETAANASKRPYSQPRRSGTPNGAVNP